MVVSHHGRDDAGHHRAVLRGGAVADEAVGAALLQYGQGLANLYLNCCCDDDATNATNDATSSSQQQPRKRGILKVAQRYRASLNAISDRKALLDECNTVMQNYEDAEEAQRLEREGAANQPDDDGFVTVSYSNAVGSQVELEESAAGATPSRRKGNKRSRKKKEGVGSKELEDFYRFQRRENKKRTLEDLRAQFEEDLRRVKRMKEDRHYKPF